MPLFIVDGDKDAVVPGTQTYEKRCQESLQRLPRPSPSEKDPLNWPLARKNFILFILCGHSILAAVLNSILAVNTFQLVAAFKVSFTKIAMLTGYNVLALAIAAVFFNATCRVYGRRHTFLIGSLLMLIGNFWAAKADTYHSILGARILEGIGIAPYEGLIQVVVADMYFVSQRGRAYACVAVSYISGAMLAPIITGKMSMDLGRRAPHFFAGGFIAPMFLLVFFFFEETAYNRPALTSDTVTRINYITATKGTEEVKLGDHEASPSPPATEVVSSIKTFAIARLSPFSGRYSDDNLLKLICRPIILLFHPAVLWGAATSGVVTAWTVMLSTDLAAIFALLTPAQLGYMYAAPLVAAVITLPIAGLSSDALAKVLTRRHGVYEPEYRILLVIPFTVAALLGLFGFGHTIKLHHIVPTIFFGFVIAAVVLGNVASATYVADAYPMLSVDCFIAFLIVKNLAAFALTVKGFDWLVKDGTVKMFNTCGYTQIAVCGLAIPMFFFGKVIRRYSANSLFWQYIFK